MTDKIVDLGECRTGYQIDEFSHTLSYESDQVPPIIETVVASNITSNSDNDSGTELIDNGDNTYTYSGLFSAESFPLLSMTFRDFDTLNDITITGWPPSDDRAKDMHTFNLDPRDTITHEIIIKYRTTATSGGIPITSPPYYYDSEFNGYIRTVEFKYMKDAVNKTGEHFSSELSSYFSELPPTP